MFKIIFKKARKPLVVFFLFAAEVMMLSGCSIITIDTMKNDPLLPMSPPPKTRASESFNEDSLPDKDVFIGIAMSGGGSRATNFSAAVLLELEKVGILQHATVMSSVSGSSLAAAYYGLYGDNGDKKHKWNEQSVRKAFLTDFEQPWLISWFNPLNVGRYWLTNFNRSDIMANLLDSELFDEHQYADLGKDKFPRIYINATSSTSGRAFVFSDEHFAERLNSRLDTYPVAKAVMASSAFPAVFHDITLKDYSIKNRDLPETQKSKSVDNYEHLIDGGPSDNLGITPIKRVLEKMSRKPKCFLFVVDAYPYQELAEHVQEADNRSWFDYIVATNLATSSDVLLSLRRMDLMKEWIPSDDVGFQSYRDVVPIRTKFSEFTADIAPNVPSCSVWHITFQRLYSQEFQRAYGGNNPDSELNQSLRRMRQVVNLVPTRYKLKPISDYSSEAVQDYLFKAAKILVTEDAKVGEKGGMDRRILDMVCDKFKGWGLSGLKCGDQY